MLVERRDRILDWREELNRLEPDLPALPAAAREAVLTTVRRFLREDVERLDATAVTLNDAA